MDIGHDCQCISECDGSIIAQVVNLSRDKYNGRSTDKIRTKKARDRPRGIAV